MRHRLTRDLICAALLTAIGAGYLAVAGHAGRPATTAWVDPAPERGLPQTVASTALR